MFDPPPVLGLFAKWPSPGAAKTRLIPGDPVMGARVARAFLLDTLDRLAGIDARRVLAFTPPQAGGEFEAVAAGRFELEPQGDGDLGQRLAAFFRRRFAEGSDAVVAVGADSPTLPPEYVLQAYGALATAHFVVGPAADGGYYLIGCGRRLPPVFDGIDWGTSLVLGQTVARLSAVDGNLEVLPPWYDVDTPGDWAMLAGHLAALRRSGVDPGVPRTEALVRDIGPILGRLTINEGPYEG
jgi:rSAM/selenodomain-associated transferase 1